MTTARTRPDLPPRPQEVARLFDKLPPSAIEAEMCVLGGLILAGTENIHIIGEVIQILRSDADFSQPRHQAIYAAIVELYDHHQSIDIVQLKQKLQDRGQLADVGGIDYLAELAESVPAAVNAPYYARIVRDKAKLRQLINAAGIMLRDAHEADDPADLIIDRAEKEIFLIRQAAAVDEPMQLNVLVSETFERLQEGKDSGRTITGLSTGYHQLNDDLSGLQAGEMIIIAARPSMGKTALALNIAEHIAVDEKQPVAVFSLEMGKQQLAQRLMSSRSGVDSQRMRRNLINDQELARLKMVCEELYDAPMYIDDTPGLSVLAMRAKSRRLVSEKGVKAIFIDYLQLMSSPGAESRQQEVSEISRGIKALARELNVPIIALSQLNRKPEGRTDNRPMLSDLRESGSIEQDADVVMMLHREEYYHKQDPEWADENPDKVGKAEVVIAKQRNGPTGVVPLIFVGETTRFENPSAGDLMRADRHGDLDAFDAHPGPPF